MITNKIIQRKQYSILCVIFLLIGLVDVLIDDLLIGSQYYRT